MDEKLHTTLEMRLTDSFGVVTEQLGRVQLGLGEMKDLANGVGDLKRVLTNVKTQFLPIECKILDSPLVSCCQKVVYRLPKGFRIKVLSGLPNRFESVDVVLPRNLVELDRAFG